MIRKGVYVVTPEEKDTVRLLDQVEMALAGQPALLQYRSKEVDRDICYRQVQLLAQRCHRAGVRFIVNDDLDLALAVGADGVHLGRDDGDWYAARVLLGKERILGVSCYDQWSYALDGVSAGVDYVAFGALFSSQVKPDAVQAPLSLLTRAQKELGVCVAGIGGITLGNVDKVIAAGADLVAVISDVFSVSDPGEAVRAYQARFKCAGMVD